MSDSHQLEEFDIDNDAFGPLRGSEQPVRGRDELDRAAELAHFFTESIDLLCVAGLDGFFKVVNPAWTATLGWSLSELESEPFLDFVHPDDREATMAEVATLGAGATTVAFENRYRHRDGTYRWLLWNARPVPGRQRIYATAHDVTNQRLLEAELLGAGDCEKDRLGRELHDGLCQTLAGIAALSKTLANRLAPASQAESAAANEISQLLFQAIAEARDLARGLGPVALTEIGLEAALEALAVEIGRRFDVSCSVACTADLTAVAPEVKSHLFRIVQEAVSNALSHGECNRIEIDLSTDKERGVLCIRDDGVGLPKDETSCGGIGFHTMAYRARLIGGAFDVGRRRDRGTRASCKFPLPRALEAVRT